MSETIDRQIQDFFSGPNGPLSASWAPYSTDNLTFGDIEIDDGQAVAKELRDSAAIYINSLCQNQYIDIISLPSGPTVTGLFVRASALGAYHASWFNSTIASISKWTAGGQSFSTEVLEQRSDLGDLTNISMRLRVFDSTLTLYRNGVEILSVIDTSFTSGRVGMYLAGEAEGSITQCDIGTHFTLGSFDIVSVNSYGRWAHSTRAKNLWLASTIARV